MSDAEVIKIPAWWLQDKDKISLLNQLDNIKTGTAIAAIKCLLAIALSNDKLFSTTDISITELEVITGLSRPMVIRGVKKLEEMGVVRVERTRRTQMNLYQLLAQSDKDIWVTLPNIIVRERLKNVPNRGPATRTALKLYLKLLSMRNKDISRLEADLLQLQDLTAADEKGVKAGLRILSTAGLLAFTAGQCSTQSEFVLSGFDVTVFRLQRS